MSASYKTKMPFVFEWPEGPKFASSFACRFLPRSGQSKFANTIISPVWNLFDISRPFVLFFSWFLFIAFYILLYYAVPISFLNSSDGQYVSGGRTVVVTIVLYYLVSILLIGVLQDQGCKDLEEQASAYLYSTPASIPSTLQDTADELYRRRLSKVRSEQKTYDV
jgi:hypothetical protein